MAFGLKYELEFRQEQKDLTTVYKIEIYKEGYGGGASTLVAGETPITIEEVGGNLLKNPLVKTSGILNLWNTTEGQYSEFLTAAFGDYYLNLIEDPNGTPRTLYTLFNTPETMTERYTQPPYNLATRWGCGLSSLRYIRFDYSGGTLFGGQKSLIEVVRICLNKLPVALGVRDALNIYDDSMLSTTTDSTLAQTYVDSSLYREAKEKGLDTEEVGMYCDKVLEYAISSFLGQIYQYEGYWYFIRLQGYNDATVYYTEFLPRVGSESTLTVDASGSFAPVYTITGVDKGNVNELAIIGSASEVEILEPLNRVQLTFKSNTLQFGGFNILQNGDFQLIRYKSTETPLDPNYSGFPTYWTEGANVDSYTYEAMKKTSVIWQGGSYWTGSGQHEKRHLFTFEPSEQQTANNFDPDLYISKSVTDLPLTTGDKIRFEIGIDLFLAFTGLTGGLRASASGYCTQGFDLIIEMQITWGAYTIIGNNESNPYAFSNSASGRCYFRIRGGFDAITWNNNTEPYNATRRQTTLIKFEVPLPPVTALADFEFRLYRPYSTVAAHSAAVGYNVILSRCDFGMLGCWYVPSDDNTVEDIVLYQEISEDEEVLKLNLFHADGETYLSQNSFRLSSFLVTDSWNRRGKTDALSIMQLLAEALRDLRGEYVKKLNTKLIGNFERYAALEHTVGITTTKYMQHARRWDVKKGEYDLALIELDEFTTLVTVSETYRTKARQDLYPEPIIIGDQSEPDTKNLASNQLIVRQGAFISLNDTDLENFL